MTPVENHVQLMVCRPTWLNTYQRKSLRTCSFCHRCLLCPRAGKNPTSHHSVSLRLLPLFLVLHICVLFPFLFIPFLVTVILLFFLFFFFFSFLLDSVHVLNVTVIFTNLDHFLVVTKQSETSFPVLLLHALSWCHVSCIKLNGCCSSLTVFPVFELNCK